MAHLISGAANQRRAFIYVSISIAAVRRITSSRHPFERVERLLLELLSLSVRVVKKCGPETGSCWKSSGGKKVNCQRCGALSLMVQRFDAFSCHIIVCLSSAAMEIET